MSAGTYDLHIKRGVPFRQKFTLQTANGLPFDLTGRTAKAQVRRNPLSLDLALLTFQVEDGTMLMDTAEGSVILSVSGEATLAIKDAWDAVWDLFILPAASPALAILEGKVTFSGTVTRFV